MRKILRFDLSPADMLGLVIPAVQAIPADIVKIDESQRTVTAKTRLSLKSKGENIRVQVEALGQVDSQCQVQIDSELLLILVETQFDWGVNAHNIEMFEKALQSGLRQWKKAHKAAAPAKKESASLKQMQCSACGAALVQQANNWKCEYCGHVYLQEG